VGDTQVTFRVEDEERRLSARSITVQVQEDGKPVTKPNPKARDRMDRLVLLLGVPFGNFGQAIVDYQDTDKEGEFEDGDDDLPLLSFGEMLLVKGFTEEVMYGKGGKDPHEQGLAPWLTVWGSGAVNINTAPLEVLMCLHEKVTKAEAERIISFRDSKKQDGTYNAFAQIDKAVLINDVRLTEELADILVDIAKEGGLGVKGTNFSVFLRARTGNFESRARVVLKRDSANVTVLFWDDDQRFTRMEK
jgi:type II secretory pathway component PulK